MKGFPFPAEFARRTVLSVTVAAVVVTLSPHRALRAQAPDSTAVPTVSQGSPRASLEQFTRLADAGNWAAAAEYLIVPAAMQGRAEELAQRLDLVLDQRLAIDLGSVSPLAVGDTTDGDPTSDLLGTVAGRNGEVGIRMVQSVDQVPPRWMFTAATVSNVDALFDDIGAPWVREYVPEELMREGPFNVFLWQWIGLAIAIPLLLVVAWLLSTGFRSVLGRIAARSDTDWDDRLIERLRGPFRLWIVALGLVPIVQLLDINVRMSRFMTATARGLVLIAIFWGLLRLIRLAQSKMEANAFQHGQVQARTLIPLLGNIVRVTLVIVAVLVALAQFGYPVGTLLAGLGIGGIAVALAAQKTVEHLFGSISLAADKAFRVGDWVRAGETSGAIERIGLRSTSFRTIDRTVVRIPNGRLADERIETYGERDRMLLRTDLDLTYGTTAAQIEAIRAEVIAVLRAHPKVWPDTIRAHFVAFAESALRINVMAWFQTTSLDEFLLIQNNMYLEFMRIVEGNGSGFAFPTRTVHVVGDDPFPVAIGANGSRPVEISEGNSRTSADDASRREQAG